MKKILLSSLFGVFLASNISKWYVCIFGDIRIYYNHLALLLWLCLAVPWLQHTHFKIPKEIKVLLLLKALFIGIALIAIPSLMSEITRAELTTYVKGVAVIGFEGFSIIVILLFMTRLQPAERNTVVNLYLAAVSVCLAYTFAQAWAIYAWNVDLDLIVSSMLPFWNGTSPGIEREVFGLASGTYYRLNGFTGDPNLNGMTFLVALPMVFHRAFEKGSLSSVVLLFLMVGAILLTVSNTAILLTLPVLLLLSSRYWRRSKWISLAAASAFAGLGFFLLVKYGAEIEETLLFKLDQKGTASSHLDLASEAWSIWQAHPFGVGVNSYPRYSPAFSAHNSYAQTLVELGPLGLFHCLVWALFSVGVCWRYRKGAGFAAMLSIGALAFGAIGHDLLNRFEFQIVLNLLVAIVILNHRDRLFLQDARPAPPGDFSTATDSPARSLSVS